MMRKRYVFAVFLTVLSQTTILMFTLPTSQAQIQGVTLPASAPMPWMMEYDGSKYIWYAGSEMNVKGYIVRINGETVLANPSASVQSWQVTPNTNPEGSWYGVSVGVAIGGLWTGAVCPN